MTEWLTEAVIIQVLATLSAVAVAWIALRGKLASIGKDASEAKAASVKTESSINNRDSPLSDRLDVASKAAIDALEAVKDVAETLKTHGQKLDTHTKDLRGVDESVGILRSADRDLQKGLAHTQRELNIHIAETGPMKDKINRLAGKFLKD